MNYDSTAYLPTELRLYFTIQFNVDSIMADLTRIHDTCWTSITVLGLLPVAELLPVR